MKLSRAEFKSVVAEATRYAVGLSREQRDALLKVGDTAKAAGASFFSQPDACPVGQAFEFNRDDALPRPLVRFAFAYDDILAERYNAPRRIEVVD